MAKPPTRVTHLDIFSALVKDIHAGLWEINDRLPTEKQLVDRFGVARPTVREALRRLVELGYIQRHRGMRSILISTSPTRSFVNSVSSVDQLILYAKSAHSRIVGSRRVVSDESLAAAFGCPIGKEWIRVDYLRFTDLAEKPLCYSNIYFETRFEKVLPLLQNSPSAYDIIEKTFGIEFSRVEQQIEAGSADESTAMPLGVEIGSSVLKVRTAFIAEEGPLEFSLTWFPEGRYSVRFTFERRSSN